MLTLFLFLAILPQSCYGRIHHHRFVVKSSSYTRLCNTKNILTVNGMFPGPTLKANKGDTLIIKFYNQAQYNITLHWHGVKQARNPWSDGAAFINQCPIRAGKSFTYKIHLTDEEGTIWWHAHIGWARATIHGMIIVYPVNGQNYPFRKPYAEIPILLGEWWKKNVMEIEENANKTGGEPILSDAYTINGQPGDLYPCSKQETFRVEVEQGKTYLLRIVSAIMDENVFFAIANHKLVLVGTDGFYTKPFETDYIMITPGQSMDILFEANQPITRRYYLAARAYSSAIGAGFDNTTTTAILHYKQTTKRNLIPSSPLLPSLPHYNDTRASTEFTSKFKSLASKDHPIEVPLKINTHLFFTVSVNLLNCSGENPCDGPYGKRFSASVNNVSFVPPKIDILRAYYYNVSGVFGRNFPENPPKKFDYTGEDLGDEYLTPEFGTRVLVLEYNASVELVLQGTNVLASDNHPIHLHGYGFYVVGSGFSNFDPEKDTLGYNLVDPPQETTVGIPNNGWVAVRFRADNPGVWLLHCHLERHQSWGMSTVFVVKNGDTAQSKILPPPYDLPSCSD
ncbi:hypothetical protein ABFX02_02G062400 [Erythranthe guttata]